MDVKPINSTSSEDRPVRCRGIRGAITVPDNSREAILVATRELLEKIVECNNIDPDDVASIFFTTTTDLDAEYPALAARQIGWVDVALLCGHEMNVPGSLRHCLRVLVHWNTSRRNNEIQHVYLRDAVNLRPDKSLKTLESQKEQTLVE